MSALRFTALTQKSGLNGCAGKSMTSSANLTASAITNNFRSNQSNQTGGAATEQNPPSPCAVAEQKRTYTKNEISTEANEWNLTL